MPRLRHPTAVIQFRSASITILIGIATPHLLPEGSSLLLYGELVWVWMRAFSYLAIQSAFGNLQAQLVHLHPGAVTLPPDAASGQNTISHNFRFSITSLPVPRVGGSI